MRIAVGNALMPAGNFRRLVEKSSKTFQRLKDCIVPAIGKMNGCHTTGILALCSELAGFAIW